MNNDGLERARDFLREIRDSVASHPLAARNSRIELRQRRRGDAWQLRMSGTLDGVEVKLVVEVPDGQPGQPRLRYSSSLDRLRWAPVLGLGTSAFTVAHDRAMARCFGREPAADELRRALAVAAVQGSTGLH